MPARQRSSPSTVSRPARPWLPGGLALALLILARPAIAFQPGEADALLQKADQIRTSDPAAFGTLIESLAGRSSELTHEQLEYVHYLQGYKSAYDGRLDEALSRFEATARETHDPTLKFRANASIINVLQTGSHFEEAFNHLAQLLAELPRITAPAAREQGLNVAAQLYNEVGQYDLAISYSQKLIDENWLGRGRCKGSDQKLEAQMKSGRTRSVGPEFAAAIDSCTKHGELGYANFIRTYAATIYIANDQLDEAIRLLSSHYGEALQTRYRRLASNFESLLAVAYQRKGNHAEARKFALRAVAGTVADAVTEPQVAAYRVLYEEARREGNWQAALDYHEKYTSADKGYLDVTTARQLAYQRVAHESLANRLQIDSLNRQNHVLQLEHALAAKAIENSRLYIMLLLMTVAFIGFWAYRTKRLQLHFMNLSQLDGLTGIANRPHFLQQAQEALAAAAKSHQPACILLCDLDHFKSINDRFGHAAGDRVLKLTAAECKACMGSDDLFGRFGGEEFAFLLAGSPQDAALLRAEQLRLSIARIPVSEESSLNVSASFGLACTASSGYDLRQLLAHADAALYAAKHAGRNCIAVYDRTISVVQVTATELAAPLVPEDPSASDILGLAPN